MMLVGALAGFVVTAASGSMLIGYVAAMLAGMALALLFGFLTLTLQTNQVATGLALTLFGLACPRFSAAATRACRAKDCTWRTFPA